MILFDLEQPALEPEKKKRGRKPLRPNDPIRTKTEEKDKFWLRAFRSFVRKFVDIHCKEFVTMSVPFGSFTLARMGNNERKKRDLFYGRLYKNLNNKARAIKLDLRKYLGLILMNLPKVKKIQRFLP